MRDSTITLLLDLIAIDSVNPSLVPGGAGESGVAARAADEMRAIGLDVEITEAAPGRPNVVGVMQGSRPGPSLMFCGHLDTVGVAGMKVPFDPAERGGRIYGRGSQDMKGGLAAMIGAAARLAAAGGIKAGRLILAGVADEEYASVGAADLVKHWRADAAVITEPTDLIVAIGHRGFSWVEITTEGRAAHGSRPLDGRDAILRMGRVMARLERLDRELQSRTPDPVLGTGSLHASLIEGGREMSTYPDRCVLKIERRTVMGESIDTALHEARLILDDLKREDPEFIASASLMFGREPYQIPEAHPLAEAVSRAVSETGREVRQSGMSFWTDAAILGSAGIPTVIFGPGGAGLHSIEEYVIAEEVLACRDALASLASRFCA
jgi:acetylornithine deacetylase